MMKKVLSGGQTGVDRAALDVALALGLPCGGWCPKGRKTEDGPLSPRYPLVETPSEDYAQRTEWNVRDADGTLVLTRGAPSEGTGYTVQVAERLKKPVLVVDLWQDPREQAVWIWATRHHIQVLNVAGPRESKCPGIYGQARTFLHNMFSSQQRLGSP
jgi:hypothetical protein